MNISNNPQINRQITTAYFKALVNMMYHMYLGEIKTQVLKI